MINKYILHPVAINILQIKSGRRKWSSWRGMRRRYDVFGGLFLQLVWGWAMHWRRERQ